ncbi:hypothetical protein BH11ACT8_BH11ACT8_26730 [soil metagenome]
MEPAYFDPLRTRPEDLSWPIKVGRDSSAPTWRVANGPRYQRIGGGYYVALPRSSSVEQRIIEAASRLGPDPSRGCVTGWAGLDWHGAAYFDGAGPHGGDRLPVEINMSCSNMIEAPGTLVTQRSLAPSERMVVDGLSVATVQRCLFDEVRRRNDLWQAVTAIDMAAAAGLISVWQFATYVGTSNGATGAPLAREAVSLAVDEARSPRECWCRLCWRLIAALPDPLVNPRLYALDGRLLGIPDLFDPESGTAVEYQGVHHKGIRQHHDDVMRAELFREHGIEMIEIVQGDTRGQAADRMLRAHRRALLIPDSRRAWTLSPPPGVTRAETLDERLEHLGLAGSLTHH